VTARSGTGTKKTELLNLLQRIPECDRAVLLCALDWLPISRALRAPNLFEEGTLDWYSVDEAHKHAAERFAVLENAGLANRTFHRDTKAAAKRMYEACQAEGIPVPRTGTYDPNKHSQAECIALDKDACNSVQDEVLTDYSELSHLAKMLSADIPVLRSGAIAPIHTHFEELLETGRTGSSKPNVQNRARGEKCQVCRGKKCQVVCLHCMGTGAELGDRECFVPRPGWVMVDSDYALGELHTLAQACLWLLGNSELAKALKEGKDPHTAMAGEILGISYEESVKLKKIKDGALDNARNAGKAVNFGKPGGLSAKTMRAYAVRTYGVDKPLDEWERILKIWERLWTEMPEFFRYIDKLPKRRGQASIERAKHEGKIQQLYSLVQPYSQRLRAGATYCATCNSVYQGLLADVLKKAGWYIFCCSYLSSALVESLLGKAIADDGAGLYGCRPCNEIHDQFLIEAKEAQGVPAARSTGLLMNRAGAEVLPDVPVKCEPILTRRWSKRADLVKVDGVMVAWEDPRLVRAVESVN
jgi:DNA polymerase I-like protein with 3'-5' exonuclease and polymerase domains